MKKTLDDQKLLITARRRVRQIQIFYFHLVLYIIVVALLLYNFYIVEGPYKNNIIALNLSVLLVWTVFTTLHGLIVFKGRQIFKKRWEDRKIEEFLEKENEVETTTWE